MQLMLFHFFFCGSHLFVDYDSSWCVWNHCTFLENPFSSLVCSLVLFALCYEEIFDWDASTCCASRMRGNRRRSMRRRWEFARPWPVGVLWDQWGCSGKASSYGTAVWGRAVKAYCRHGRRSNKAVEGIYVLTVRFPLDAYRWRVRDCWNRRPQSLRDDLAWSEFAFEEVCEGN